MAQEGSWERCSQLYRELSAEERSAFRAIVDGTPSKVWFFILGRLEALGLITHDGRAIVPTDAGRARVEWFDSRPGS